MNREQILRECVSLPYFHLVNKESKDLEKKLAEKDHSEIFTKYTTLCSEMVIVEQKLSEEQQRTLRYKELLYSQVEQGEYIKELEEAVFVLGMALSRFGRNADRTLYGKNPEGVHRGFKFADDIWTQYESLIREIKDKAR